MKQALLMREAETAHTAKPLKAANGRRVNRPGDSFEREADRVADAVSRGTRAPHWSFRMLTNSTVQRQPTAGDAQGGQQNAPQPNNYSDALKKVAEALLKTKTGEEMIQHVTEDPQVKAAGDFVKTPAGIAVTGVAATGAIAALAATHHALPAQLPAIPLDAISPKLAGFKLKLTYEGPVDKPTKAMLTLSFEGKSEKKKDKQTASEKYRAETARMAADQEKFRAGMQQGGPAGEQQKKESQLIQNWELSRVGKLPGSGQTWDLSQMGKNYPQYDLHMRPADAEKQEDKPIQRKAASDAEVMTDDAEVDGVLRSSGNPLDQETRRYMESRIGFDFGHVRIHTGERASASAKALNARAYTVGNDIVFSEGRFSPGTAEGRRLLAHELTHVVQQSGSQRVARAAQPAGGASISRAHAGMVQREPEKTQAELNWFEKGMITAAAAPAAVMGSTVHDMVEATFHGFLVEVKTQAPSRSAELWEKVKDAFKHPIDQLAPFIGHYWWGLVKGIFSPITGLFDMAKLVVKLNSLGNQILSTAWAKRSELAGMAAGLAKTMDALGQRAGQAIEGLKAHPVETVKALGPWFSSLEKDAIAKAEQGGHAAGNALMEQMSKPLPELGETAGEIIGSLLINIVLLVFTEGIGNAITQVATKLGELGSMLGKLGEAAAMLGKLATGIGDVLATIGGWITKAETMIAKVAETVLKPLAPLLEELGNLVGGLRSFLRELLGVSEKEASTAAEELTGAASRELEPKAPAVNPKAPPDTAAVEPAQPKPVSSNGTKKLGEPIDVPATGQVGVFKPRSGPEFVPASELDRPPAGILESKGAGQVGGPTMKDPISGEEGRVLARAQTPRSLHTGIDASAAEDFLYKDSLRRGYVGLQKPGHVNAPGLDALFARRTPAGDIEVVFQDATINAAKKAYRVPPDSWVNEADSVIAKLGAGDPAAAEIQAALKAKRWVVETTYVEVLPNGLRFTPL